MQLQHPNYDGEPSSDHVDWAPPPIAEHLEGLSSQSEGSDTSGRHRATVEDVEDEDDVRSSSSSEDSHGRTKKYYHPKLNGMYQLILAKSIY